ncbi:hypothetical protein AERYTH_08710 [Aeromicrobium erythreum]|uniref:Uncharacterized protein n=1 Tax=Aeromicrobium erythreum TaxID=2041 RepID=A0A0U3KIU2_9ACTN|nr:hypothetical protein AERYTH_08710 [Aeromicrobium erythreum]
MSLRTETQANEVGDMGQAVRAAIAPILHGLLFSTKLERIEWHGGYEVITLKQLAVSREPGDGDLGICFEYAAHDAVARGEESVVDRVSEALKLCRVGDGTPSSILFGAEKAGAQSLIATAASTLTDDSRVMSGVAGRPVKLKRHLDSLARAFRQASAREALPGSIRGLWRADLFLGTTDDDRWVGTSVKHNPRDLTPGGQGMRIGLVPLPWDGSDLVRLDEQKNLVICPVPYNDAFMEVFNVAWRIVAAVMAARGKQPKAALLALASEQFVAKELVDRMNLPVLEVIEAMRVLGQPHLLRPKEEDISLVPAGRSSSTQETGQVVAPVPVGLSE